MKETEQIALKLGEIAGGRVSKKDREELLKQEQDKNMQQFFKDVQLISDNLLQEHAKQLKTLKDSHKEVLSSSGEGDALTPRANSTDRVFTGSTGSSVPGVAKAGWLTKQGGNVKNWKKRYCVLSSTRRELYYYESDKGKQMGVVDLRQATSVRASIEPKAPGPAIEIVTKDRVWVFASTTKQDCDEWLALVKSMVVN